MSFLSWHLIWIDYMDFVMFCLGIHYELIIWVIMGQQAVFSEHWWAIWGTVGICHLDLQVTYTYSTPNCWLIPMCLTYWLIISCSKVIILYILTAGWMNCVLLGYHPYQYYWLILTLEVVSKISCLISEQVLWFQSTLSLFLENQSSFTMSDYREKCQCLSILSFP